MPMLVGCELVVRDRSLAERLVPPMLVDAPCFISRAHTIVRLGGPPGSASTENSEDCVEDMDGYWETNSRSLKDLHAYDIHG